MSGAARMAANPAGPMDVNEILDQLVYAGRQTAKDGVERVTQEERDEIMRELRRKMEEISDA